MEDKVRKIVEALLAKLEGEGVGGVHAWFVGRPNILVRRDPHRQLYEVLMWREGVVLEIDVDEEGNVKHIYVKTASS